MSRIAKKLLILATFILLTASGVFSANDLETVSTAETDYYILSITEITDILELSSPDSENDSVLVYTLPVGSVISLTAKSDGITHSISCYDEYNRRTRTFYMKAEGETDAISGTLKSSIPVYYTVSEKDTNRDFMSIDIIAEGEKTSYFFVVESAEKDIESDDISESDYNDIDLFVTAIPTDSRITVNGEVKPFQAYEIDGFNYFKLRDIAYSISGTKKQFEVEWNERKKAISLTSGVPYTPVGNEMEISGDKGNRTGMATQSVIYLDNKETSFVAYNIDDYNYFKLRDLGRAMDFAVIWDGSTGTIIIDTEKGYEE